MGDSAGATRPRTWHPLSPDGRTPSRKTPYSEGWPEWPQRGRLTIAPGSARGNRRGKIVSPEGGLQGPWRRECRAIGVARSLEAPLQGAVRAGALPWALPGATLRSARWAWRGSEQRSLPLPASHRPRARPFREGTTRCLRGAEDRLSHTSEVLRIPLRAVSSWLDSASDRRRRARPGGATDGRIPPNGVPLPPRFDMLPTKPIVAPPGRARRRPGTGERSSPASPIRAVAGCGRTGYGGSRLCNRAEENPPCATPASPPSPPPLS